MGVKKIKACTVFFFLAFGIASLTINDRFVQTVESFSTGPPAGVTGAPGETTCAKCHFSNPGPGQFNILDAPSVYNPGQTYQIQVRHTTTDTTRRRWGFEM